MKFKSKKLAKLEKERYSVFTANLDKCYFCPNPRQDLHEIMSGKNRLNSIKYGYVLPVCRRCHDIIQYDNKYKQMCQRHFEREHTREEWISIFHMNYIQ